MPGLGLVGGPLMINSVEQDSRPNSSKPAKEPITPEPDKQTINRGRFGLPTPDATPESQRIASGDHRHDFVHPGSQRDAGPATPSISSKAPSAEETTINKDQPRRSIHSEVTNFASERPSSPLISGLHLQQENSHPVSVARSVLDSLISFLNLAKQRKSRADDARVQSTIDLIKEIPTIRRTRVGNLTRTLTAKQYGELLRAIQESEDEKFQSYCRDELRFDYTRHKKRFEIRMPTTMHEELGDYIMHRVSLWRQTLESSTDSKIVNATKTIKSSGSADIKFPFARGEGDSKSPDRSFKHKHCELKPRCVHPTLVIEIGWSQEMKYLQEKAEAYICRSKGQIRTVVAVYMRKMYLAEVKNENRLFKTYMAGEVDEAGSYPNDEKNETGEASILVWRAVVRRNGTVDAVRVQNEEFRDEKGRPVGSVSLRLPLQDFICKGIADSSAGRFQEHLEISSEALCESINDTLMDYREERAEIKIHEAEEEKEKRARDASRKGPKKKKEARTRGAVDRTSDGKGILGRISEQGRLVSTRFKKQENQR
ncbi:hypothetical protein F5Y12DRAFT_728256 [Xylaria sp. FL1777]|nr:hypothetical protein F5Y12DRAFT_728256 [Xylaria sp. FL1777]